MDGIFIDGTLVAPYLVVVTPSESVNQLFVNAATQVSLQLPLLLREGHLAQ